MARRRLGLLVAALLATGGSLLPTPVASAAPAAAAACAGAAGVTVVVDYNELGDPDLRAACVANGGGDSAAQLFRDAGFSLEYHPQQPGYVCRVTGLPAAGEECLANNAFWSLWWSDGRSGRWVFSNQSTGGLSVPEGGYVAFAWHEGAGNAQPPDVVPTPHEEPEPSGQPSQSQGGNGGNGPNQGGGGGTTTAPATSATAPPATATTSGATVSVSPVRKKRDRSESASVSETTQGSSVPGAAEITAGPPESDLSSDSSDGDGGSLPTWIGMALAVVVLGAAGVIAFVRRRPG